MAASAALMALRSYLLLNCISADGNVIEHYAAALTRVVIGGRAVIPDTLTM
ncbi:uncharacterized protein V6R79_007093 [Siganus canaliculatus]